MSRTPSEDAVVPGLRGRDKRQEKRQEKLQDQHAGQGVIRDNRGQDQPADKRRAQQDSGLRAQKDSAEQNTPSPGQPAHGE
jgi:hypothetical protein